MLLYTPNVGYDMRDWAREPVVRVFAGLDCLLALTADGRVLQKTKKPEYALRTQYWTRIGEIALSGSMPCHAIGLVRDGTCMISKRYLRDRCSQGGSLRFEEINGRVKGWTGIVQTAVSGAFFALDGGGRVHVSPLFPYERGEYADAEQWRDICRIETGLQDSLFGITRDGRVLCAGANLTRGPHGDIRARLSEYRDAADICATGSECEEILIALKDGTVISTEHGRLPVTASAEALARGERVFRSHFWYETAVLGRGRILWRVSRGEAAPVFENGPPIASFAMGSVGYAEPFIVAVTERQ